MEDTRNEIEAGMETGNEIEVELEAEEERQRKLRRKRRIEQMQREKRRAEIIQKGVIAGVALAAVLLVVGIVSGVSRKAEQETPQNAQFAGADQSTGNKTNADENTENGEAAEKDGNVAENSEQTGSGEQAEAAESAGTEIVTVLTQQQMQVGPDFCGPLPMVSAKAPVFKAVSTDATVGFGDEIVSQYGVLIDVEEGTIVAQKEAKTRINPASMTKILTVLTAADELGLTGDDWENAAVLDDTFTITIEITDYSYVNDCSNVGFEVGEEVTVRDLFYGTILPSGGDAALGLACYVAGSQEAFVELMNEKLEELGLSESSHFTNCVGLYDKEHYSTVYDMAVMLKTAADSEFCRDVLSAHTYLTSATEPHPEGLLISNWFLRRIEDKDTHGEVLCGKTGYVVQSGSCAASLAADGAGREYLCVTAGSNSSWGCIYDQVALYSKHLAAAE